MRPFLSGLRAAGLAIGTSIAIVIAWMIASEVMTRRPIMLPPLGPSILIYYGVTAGLLAAVVWLTGRRRRPIRPTLGLMALGLILVALNCWFLRGWMDINGRMWAEDPEFYLSLWNVEFYVTWAGFLMGLANVSVVLYGAFRPAGVPADRLRT